MSEPQDDFAASLAAAAALEPDATESEPDAGDVEDASDEPATGAADADGQGDDSGADDSADEDDDSAEDEGEDSSAASGDVDAIRQKFLDGDVDEALKDLGLDPKILEVNGPKLKAMREGLKAARELEASAAVKLTESQAKAKWADQVIADGKAKYGHLVDLKLALGKGDFTAARDLLEALAPEGTTYKQIAEGLARAAAGMSPSERIYRDKLRKMAEDERKAAEAAEAEKNKPVEQKPEVLAQKNLDGAKKLLEKTTFSDIPGAAEKLVQLAAENWDPVKKGLKVPKEQLVKLLEKDPVIGQLLELKQLKAKKAGGKAPAKVEAPAVRDPKGRFRERPASKLTPEQQHEARRAAEFKASVAQAAAMERQERRAAGAGKGRR